MHEVRERNVRRNAKHSNCQSDELELFWNKILHSPEECAFSGGKRRCILLEEMSRYSNYSPECNGVCKFFALRQERD